MKWNRITSEEAISALGVNAKPHLLKRLFAGLIDVVILFFAQVLLYALLAMTPVASYVNKYQNKIITLQEEYKVAAGYALEEQVESTYNGKSILHYNEESEYYYIVHEVDFGDDTEAKNTAYKAYVEMLNQSDYYEDLTFKYHLHNYILGALVCGGIVELIMFLVIPLINNCGQTPGMLIMSIRLYNPKYMGKPKWYQYLGRFAFLFIVMMAIPYIFLAQWTVLAAAGLDLVVLLLNKQNRGIEDFISGVAYVEKKTFKDLDEEEPVEVIEEKVEEKPNE